MANCSKQIHIWTQLYIYVFKHTDHDSWKNGYCFTWGMKKGAESEETMLPISSFSQCWELMHPEPPRPRWHFTSRCRFNILWHKVLSSAALMAHIHAIPTALFHDELSLSLSLSLSVTQRKTRLCSFLCLAWDFVIVSQKPGKLLQNTHSKKYRTEPFCLELLLMTQKNMGKCFTFIDSKFSIVCPNWVFTPKIKNL